MFSLELLKVGCHQAKDILVSAGLEIRRQEGSENHCHLSREKSDEEEGCISGG